MNSEALPTSHGEGTPQSLLEESVNAEVSPWLSARRGLSVFLVLLTSGILFYLSAESAAQRGEAAERDLVDLVRNHQTIVGDLEKERKVLADEVLKATENLPTVALPPMPASHSSIPVQGPGIVITLNDAPPGEIPDGLTANDLVIHQQDIEDVMNAMWAGGAEAMTVQGQRISARSVIRCIGNVILVDGNSYSPPYQIAAIGDVERMKTTIESDPRVENYMQYVSLYGLGWKLQMKDSIEMAGSSQDITVRHAKVVN